MVRICDFEQREPRNSPWLFPFSWEQRPAKELCSIGTGKSNTQDQTDDGEYPFFIRSDIPVRSNKYLYDCEAVITIGDGNIGKVFHYVNGKFDLHQRCYKMTDFKDVTGRYFYYFFATKFYDRAMRMTAKATVDSVRLEMISEMDISYPSSPTEQRKIALFFGDLDCLITLHQRKQFCICPKFGIFHNEKTNAWEQRKFETFAQRKAEFGNSELLPTVEYEDIVSDLGQLNKDISKKNTIKTGLKFSRGDVLFGKLRPYLKNWLLPEFSGVAVGDFWVLKPLEIDSKWLYYLLQTPEFFLISNQSAGSKMPRSDWKLVSKYDFSIPSEKMEQKKIGAFFQALDRLITLHQRKPLFLFLEELRC